jgi:HD-GYP domain-containing protein (c-di-GMP phosphodiesterase class II)
MARATDLVNRSCRTDSEKESREVSPFRFSQILSPALKVGTPPPATDPVMESNDLNVESVYLTLRDYMLGIQRIIKRGERIGIEMALPTIGKIVENPEMLAGINPMMIKLSVDDDYYILQPIHTMIYALKMGLLLNYTRTKMTEIALAALLQNVGMFLIPEEIVNKAGKLTEEEILLIKKHPESGRDILTHLNNEFPSVVEAVYQHHERENGDGYPRKLKGDAIVEYAQIIGICDSYEAMSRNRPHKKALLQFTSVRQLIETKEKLFAPRIIKAFLEEMSLYPVGSYVRLNNGSIGRVIKTSRQQPVKPIVRLIFDGRGNKTNNNEYTDLSKTGVLSIADVITEADLPA